MSNCCQKAQSYGLVLFGRAFSSRDVSFMSEIEELVSLYTKSVALVASPDLTYKSTKSNNFFVSLETQAEREKLLKHFGHDAEGLHLRVNRANLSDECCFSAFLRGAFLACGTISSPYKSYHLEFVVAYKKLSDDLALILTEVGFPTKYVLRKGNNILYLKDSGLIEYLLAFMGSDKAALEFMGIKAERDLRNRVNRRTNCDMANLDRIVKAAGEQIHAIDLILAHDKFDDLPKHLKEVANLRLSNPELSLSDLGKLLEKPISRSGLNHRFKTLIKLAKDLET
ncbi:MAG: DNA-binding protein WhiA [Clostridiales bacterium]|jgi:DNA-binding protein WhiA|nr:DNA-binding protein WhiA [Clostridiales bacterium]